MTPWNRPLSAREPNPLPVRNRDDDLSHTGNGDVTNVLAVAMALAMLYLIGTFLAGLSVFRAASL